MAVTGSVNEQKAAAGPLWTGRRFSGAGITVNEGPHCLKLRL
jgi:hypothetical protein